MAHHTKKRKSHRRSTKVYSKRPTIREHGFRIVSHRLPVKGAPRSMKNIHLSIHNRIPRANGTTKMNIAHSMRASMPRASKSAYQVRREQEQMLEQFKKNNQKERKSQKAAHASAMENLNDMFSKMAVRRNSRNNHKMNE